MESSGAADPTGPRGPGDGSLLSVADRGVYGFAVSNDGAGEVIMRAALQPCPPHRANLSATAGLEIEKFQYLGQYPNYLMFNAALFLLGTAYDKLVSRFEILRFLRGWILVTLRRP